MKGSKNFFFEKKKQKTFIRLRRRPGRAAESGFALIVVLWTLVLMTLVVTHLNAAGRTETKLAANIRDATLLDAAADGAVEETLFHLLDQSGRHWTANGTTHAMSIGGFSVTVRVESEADKINPNTAPPELLAALLHRIGADRGLSGAIVAARSTPFQSIDELGAITAMTPDVLRLLTPHLQLVRPGLPNSATADPVVLASLSDWSGLPPSTSGSASDESFVSISVIAHAPSGNHASREAVAHLDPAARPIPFQILDWH